MTEAGESPRPVPPLQGSAKPLVDRYDVALLDLDGVVYRGSAPVGHAAEALAAVRERGMRLAFVTNNALRPPEEVVRRIVAVGVPAEPGDVVTSAQAAARLLAERLPTGSAVLVAGGAGLRRAVGERGLMPVSRADEHPAAVVTGYDPELTYARLAEAVLAIFQGAVWIASNTDATVPTERGLLPGAGAIVAFIAAATKVTPEVAGKPERALQEESIARTGAKRPLVVGDRLDTDIQGANGVGAPSLLVLTGVSTAADLIAAPPAQRPTYVGPDLQALLRPAPEVQRERGEPKARCGGWVCEARDGELEWDGNGGPADDGLDALRAGLAVRWALAENGKSLRGVRGSVPAGCEAFAAAYGSDTPAEGAL